MTKILIVGLDGATWNVIEPLASTGELPTFKKLMENGTYGQLRSTIPSSTIPAWNSMTTGKNPGRLGIFSFMIREEHGYTFKPYFADIVEKERDFWDILSDQGKRVIVFNAPNVHSPYKINGCMIVGWLYASENKLTYPGELKAEIDTIAKGYEVGVTDIDLNEGKIVWSPVTDKRFVRNVTRVMGKRYKVLRSLLNKEWDLFFVVFTAPDRVQHRFWGDNAVVSALYKRVDSILGQLLGALEKDVILLIVSDHGFGSQNRTFNINEWLIKEGYLVLKKPVHIPFYR
jgi:predicted AlkP superfamily phosphohydrolase/phosphomutase